MPSVVIPAYNEEAGIARCLRSVLSQGVADLTVVVVANACRDATAARARAVSVPDGATVLVVDTPEGGKTNALNLGEQALRDAGRDSFPRLFLDGDIELEPGTLRALLAAAGGPGARVVAAEPKFFTEDCSLAVRLHFAAERFNPYHCRTAPNGSGTYCVSREGRARWDEFPNVIADDLFVERRFAASERKTLRGHHSVVRVPLTIRALRAIRARARLGNSELDSLAPRRPDTINPKTTLWSVASGCLANPLRWQQDWTSRS